MKVDKIADFIRQIFCFLSKHFLVHIAHRNLNESLQEVFAFESLQYNCLVRKHVPLLESMQKTLAIAELTC